MIYLETSTEASLDQAYYPGAVGCFPHYRRSLLSANSDCECLQTEVGSAATAKPAMLPL